VILGKSLSLFSECQIVNGQKIAPTEGKGLLEEIVWVTLGSV
jgi:hypothetical protein